VDAEVMINFHDTAAAMIETYRATMVASYRATINNKRVHP
jgi:hypothetical protein